LLTNHVFSQQQSDTSKLPEIVVRSPFSSATMSPVTLSNISRKELLEKNYGQEPSIILSKTPSVTFYTDAGSGAGYSYFRLRGIDQTRINMSLNGVPLNEPEDQGVYFSNYPDFLESISGVQVQRGTGFSKQGVAAYGGSLYLESLLFKDSAQKHLSAGYGSFGSYRVNASMNTGTRKGLGLYLRGSHLHSDGYKDHSGNTSHSAFLSPGYWGEKHKVYVVSFFGSQKNDLAWIGAPLDSIQKNPRFNANSRQEKDVFRQAHIQLHHDWQLNKQNRLHTGFFYNYLKGNYDFDLNNFLGMPPGNELYNYAFSSDFAGAFFYHAHTSQKFTWYNGVQTQWYNRRHTGSEKSMGVLYGNTGYRKESSVYTRGILSLGKWDLLGDIQYRYSSFTYTGDELMPGQHWNFLNGTFGLSYAIKNNLRLYFSLAQTHREPTRNDLFIGNDNLSRDGNGELLFNPVKPERAMDWEAGLKYFSEKTWLFANVYFMNFRNEITLNGQIGPTGVPLHSNAAKSYRAGLELDAMYRFANGFELRNQSSASLNRVRENDVKLRPVL
jgi:iron complex outermembrane receptor protein